MMPRWLVLYLKGCCMGLADVVPGVSGGTLALILGIYRRLVESIRDLHLNWVRPLLEWLRSGFRDPESRRRLTESLAGLHPGFFLPLGAGILTALTTGGLLVLPLLENYPVMVRSLFFGLILGSFWIPFQMLSDPGDGNYARIGVGLVLALVVGFILTDPAGRVITPTDWVPRDSRGETFQSLLRGVPSARSAERVFWHPNNRSFRRRLRNRQPEVFSRLRDHYRQHSGSGTVSREELTARSEPYHQLMVPAGQSVMVPRLPLWYVTVAGAIGICAMILPGISGAYLLLILGAYFFIMNALKGVISGLASGIFPGSLLAPVLFFSLGAGAGLLMFSRLLSYLLNQYTDWTVGALVGLMLGCLRGVWPFRGLRDGVTTNLLPVSLNATVLAALLTFTTGVLLVLSLHLLAGWFESANPETGS